MPTLYVRQSTRFGRLAERVCTVFNIPLADRDGGESRPFTRIQDAIDEATELYADEGPMVVSVEPGIYPESICIDASRVTVTVAGKPRDTTLVDWRRLGSSLHLLRREHAVIYSPRKGFAAIRIDGKGRTAINSCYIYGDTEVSDAR